MWVRAGSVVVTYPAEHVAPRARGRGGSAPAPGGHPMGAPRAGAGGGAPGRRHLGALAAAPRVVGGAPVAGGDVRGAGDVKPAGSAGCEPHVYAPCHARVPDIRFAPHEAGAPDPRRVSGAFPSVRDGRARAGAARRRPAPRAPRVRHRAREQGVRGHVRGRSARGPVSDPDPALDGRARARLLRDRALERGQLHRHGQRAAPHAVVEERLPERERRPGPSHR